MSIYLPTLGFFYSKITAPQRVKGRYEWFFADMFNLESKFFVYNYHYFCSKFSISSLGRWFLVPDPIKLFVKLGRRDLVNYDHVEEYRISLLDLTKQYGNIILDNQLSLAISERYLTDGTVINVSHLLQIILKSVNSKLVFDRCLSYKVLKVMGLRIICCQNFNRI